jgi:hypothetical protein
VIVNAVWRLSVVGTSLRDCSTVDKIGVSTPSREERTSIAANGG